MKIDPNDLFFTESIPSPQHIVEAIKDTSLKGWLDDPMTTNTYNQNSTFGRAKQIIHSDGVSFSAKLGIYTVHESNKYYCVRLSPPTCNCPLTKHQCHHILAVLIANGIDIDMSENKPVQINLTTMKKSKRGRQKAGRKRPRPDDIDIKAAADSEEAQTLHSSQSPLSQISSGVVSQAVPPQTLHSSQSPLSQISSGVVSQAVPPQVWLKSSPTIKTELSMNDRDDIENDGWLGDSVIDRAMEILKVQYPAISGLISCLEATNFQKPSRFGGDLVQIINTKPLAETKGATAGYHWVTLHWNALTVILQVSKL